jgi:hypothetical protein
VGNHGITALANGNYLVASSNYASNAGQVLIGTPGNITFATGSAAGATMSFNPSALTATLAGGTAVTLQASNDITVNADINVGGSSGGAFTLQAGRNLNLNSVITTANGNFTAVAGDPGAIAADRLAGTPTLTLSTGAGINAGTGTVTLAAIGGNFVNNSGSATPVTASQWLVYSPDPAHNTLGGMTASNEHYAQTYSAGSKPAYAANGNWLLYSVAPVPAPVVTPPVVTPPVVTPAPVVASDVPAVVAQAITSLPGGATLLPAYREAKRAATQEPVAVTTRRAGVILQSAGMELEKASQVVVLNGGVKLPVDALTTSLVEPSRSTDQE